MEFLDHYKLMSFKLSTMKKPNILVLASGDKNGGGSGFQEMVERSRTNPPILDANIVAVVSNHSSGGVYKKALALKIPFIFFTGPFEAKDYQYMVARFDADYIMCSGWLKPVRGLPERMTINIHPGPLPKFGGPGLYGHHVHEAVIAAFRRGEITQSAVSIHFVNDEYDKGVGIVRIPVLIRPEDDASSLATRVLKVEHNYQSLVLNEIIQKKITLKSGQVFFQNSELARFAFINK